MAHTPESPGCQCSICLANAPAAKAAHRVRDAAPDMLDVLLQVAENEECVCGECTECLQSRSGHDAQFTIAKKHEYTPRAPCLGCQVDAAIKLAEGE